MEKKVALIVFCLFLLLSCNQKNKIDKINYYESLKKNAYIKLDDNNITVFCNPMSIGKYGCSIVFGGKIKKGEFSKGFFLEKSKNEKKIFDTIYSNRNKYIYFKLENDKLIVNLKSDIGCNILFHDEEDGYSKESDTLDLDLVKTKIQGIALPQGFVNVKKEEIKSIETDDRPMLVLESSKDSLKVIYKVDYHDNKYSKIEKKIGWISKKDCEILK